MTSSTDAWLERYYFDRYILDVSIATLEHGGVTSRIDTYQFLDEIDAWAFPKYPSKTVVLQPLINIVEALEQFIQDNDTLLREPNTWLGTWINPATGGIHLDITTVSFDLEEAIYETRLRSQREHRNILALYNLKSHQLVSLEQVAIHKK